MIRFHVAIAAALMSSCSANTASSADQEVRTGQDMSPPVPGEPPLKCEISRGAWCFLKSPYKLTFSHAQNEPYFIWTVSEDMWADEAGFILEDDGCADHPADTLEVIDGMRSVLWRERQWREVKLRLREDGSCYLRLLVPPLENAPLDMAASALSTHISACYLGKPCAPNVVADVVYPFFRDTQNKQPN